MPSFLVLPPLGNLSSWRAFGKSLSEVDVLAVSTFKQTSVVSILLIAGETAETGYACRWYAGLHLCTEPDARRLPSFSELRLLRSHLFLPCEGSVMLRREDASCVVADAMTNKIVHNLPFCLGRACK